MRGRILLLFVPLVLTSLPYLLAIIAFTNCDKGSTLVAPSPTLPDTTSHIITLGKVAMLRDGEEWEPECKAVLSSNAQYFTISTTSRYHNGIEESFYIGDIPCIIGKYPVERGGNSTWGNAIPQATMGWVLDGDQALGGLKADTTKMDNFVEVIRYDTSKQIAEGKFQIFLKSIFSTNSGIYALPDSLSLTEGKFHLQL